MEKERLIEELIIGVFLRLKLDGYCDEISLKRDDVQEVAQKLENVLIENGLGDSDIFIKTPVEETYDYFKTWLSDRFLSLHPGDFNAKYNGIIITNNTYRMNCMLGKLNSYDSLLNQICFILIEDSQIESPSNYQKVICMKEI